MALLAEFPRLFNLKSYSSRGAKHLQATLVQLREAFLSTSEQRPLEECVTTFAMLCKCKLALAAHAVRKRCSLCQSCSVLFSLVQSCSVLFSLV